MDKLIKEFHKLYAKYKRPVYLEIAANLGKSTPDNFNEIWQRRVNEGAKRQGITPPYPDQTLLP